MKPIGFNIKVFLFIAATAAGCSPLAPSVSKMSNAGVQKTMTDQLGTEGNLKVDTANASLNHSDFDDNQISVSVVSHKQFDTIWSTVHAENPNASLELSHDSFSNLLTSWRAEFSSEAHSVLREMDNLTSKVTVYLVLAPLSGESEKKFQKTLAALQNGVEVSVAKCMRVDTACKSDWELKITSPVKPTSEKAPKDQTLSKSLQEHLVSVALDFRS